MVISYSLDSSIEQVKLVDFTSVCPVRGALPIKWLDCLNTRVQKLLNLNSLMVELSYQHRGEQLSVQDFLKV